MGQTWGNIGQRGKIFDSNRKILDRDGKYETDAGNSGRRGKIMNSEENIGSKKEILDKDGKYQREGECQR